MPLDQGHGTDTGDSEKMWQRKYLALKRKVRDYQKMNAMLFLRAKEIHRVIEKAESETRYLVKRLEQYEEVDYPRCLPSMRAEANGLIIPSPHPLSIPPPNATLMSAAAARIRAEVQSALSQECDTPQAETNEAVCSELTSPRLLPHSVERPTAVVNGNTTVVPQSMAIQGPPRLVPIPSPILDKSPLAPPKAKKIKKSFKALPERVLKPGLKGAAAAKRRKGDIDPNAPKKPSNAFFWFCQAKRAELQEQFKGEGTTGQHDLTKALAKLWGETNPEEKKPYYEQYTLDKARYDHEMEEYLRMKQAALTSPLIPPIDQSDYRREQHIHSNDI